MGWDAPSSAKLFEEVKFISCEFSTEATLAGVKKQNELILNKLGQDFVERGFRLSSVQGKCNVEFAPEPFLFT